MPSKALQKFLRKYYTRPDEQLCIRMGQFFVNKYIRSPWPELFYCHDNEAVIMIGEWLKDHQYIEDLPDEIER